MLVDFLKGSEFSIDRENYGKPHDMPALHYHNFYELYYLEEGQRNYIINDSFFGVTTGNVVLVSPFDLHRTTGGSYRRVVVYFEKKLLTDYLQEEQALSLLRCFERKCLMIPKNRRPQIEDLLNRLLKVQPPFRQLYLAELLALVASYAKEDSYEPATPNQRVSEILSYMNRNYNTIENIGEIASDFFVTEYHLCRLFKKETGVSLITYLNHIKVRHACALLAGKEKSVTEIGFACGFRSSSYFCKVFHSIAGCSPSEYRRRMRQ